MRTYIYIDGFSFYYGAVKGTKYKWLDFKKLFELLLNKNNEIVSIKYFTAIVTGKIDPDQPIRQKTFLRPLQKHIPEISIYYGEFLSHNVMKPLAHQIDKAFRENNQIRECHKNRRKRFGCKPRPPPAK